MMMGWESFALVIVACAAAAAGGAIVGGAVWSARCSRARKRRWKNSVSDSPVSEGGREKLHGGVIGYLVSLSRQLEFGATRPWSARLRMAGSRTWFSRHVECAGFAESVSAGGFCEARVRLAFASSLIGCLAGSLLTFELALVLGTAGLVVGFRLPRRALLHEEQRRAEGLACDLPEMLEVVALGLRSGLSFDRSFDLYCSHFDSGFARACAQARRRWDMGLSTRSEALRDLAGSYDSALLKRAVESIVRAQRFGSSLTEPLEAMAAESRALRKARVEERVAKASVKMMLPTGTLILPAMLLLVLGPVLLELMEGF